MCYITAYYPRMLAHPYVDVINLNIYIQNYDIGTQSGFQANIYI